ncbi:MAG TPA: hypothetical protein VNZ49_13860 [Bacteroidia bacterium]|jgi:hypothetical protein|nr:hypothetical protein [Bacteroidia bacterium]
MKCKPNRLAYLSLTFFLFCLNSFSFAQKNKAANDSEINCLEVTGKFDESMKSLEGKYTVKLMRDNKVVEEQNLKVNKGFRFVLAKDVQYTIKIEKEGYIPRLLSVSTKIPEKSDLTELFKFHFETNLIDQAFYYRFDDDDIDFPIALVSYAKKCDCFEYNKKYTQELMSRLINKLMVGGY